MQQEHLPPAPEGTVPEDEVLYALADLFRVFGDSSRIKILYALHDTELCVQDIAAAVQMSQSAVSRQISVSQAINCLTSPCANADNPYPTRLTTP